MPKGFDSLITHFLYKIFSRNLTLGVFCEKSKGFIGIREKFGYRYLDQEYHWDQGPPHGTASPKELLEECPLGLDHNSKELFEWLDQHEKNTNKQDLDAI